MPLAAAAFVAMLQLTLVGEGWPLRGLPRLAAGAAALAVSWAAALAVYFALADERDEIGTVLITIGAWQTLFYVASRGWPFCAIATRWRRLTCAHVAVIAGGILSYVVVHDVLAVDSAAIGAWTGCFIASALVFGMLLEGWLDRGMTVLASLAFTAALVIALRAAADGMSFTRANANDWVAHAGVNAIAVSILLHVAIGRRWPFARPDVRGA